MIESEKIRWI